MSNSGDLRIPNSPRQHDGRLQGQHGAPASVVEADLGVEVEVTWTIPTSLANIISPNSEWSVEVYADQLGGPFDDVIGSLQVQTVAGQTNYGPVKVLCPMGFANDPQFNQSSIFHLATAADPPEQRSGDGTWWLRGRPDPALPVARRPGGGQLQPPASPRQTSDTVVLMESPPLPPW